MVTRYCHRGLMRGSASRSIQKLLRVRPSSDQAALVSLSGRASTMNSPTPPSVTPHVIRTYSGLSSREAVRVVRLAALVK